MYYFQKSLLKIMISSMIGFILLVSSGCNDSKKKTSSKDTLMVAEMWEIDGLDPAKEGTFTKEKAMIVETLVDSNPEFKIIPGLAVSWKMISETVWEFTLRENVLFHDGSPLTAEITANSLNRAFKINPALKSLTQIQDIKAVDSLKLHISTEKLFPALPAMLVYADMAIVSPHSKMTENGIITHPIGTGPYVLKEWIKAEYKVVLKRNDNYWGKKSKIKNIIFRSITDPATRSLEIQKGSIDLIADAPYGDLSLLDKNGLKVVKASTARVYMLNFGKLKGTFFEDINVRKAITHAINRDEIVKYILFGMGKPAAGAFEKGMVFSNKELKPHPYDPDLAKEYLKKAGWRDHNNDGIVEKNGKIFETTLYTYPQRPGLKPIAMALQEQFSKIGLKINVKIMDWDAITKIMNDNDMRLSAFSTAMIPDPDYFCRRTYSTKGNYNTWDYQNKKIDELLNRASILKNEEERFNVYKEIENIIYHDLPVIMVSYYGVNIVHSPRVKGFVFNPIAHDYMLNTEMYIEE